MPVINGRGRVGIRRPSAVSALLLDTYSGAAVAYSLRKLSSAYSGSAIRVRRSSDNTEQNIGFNASGNLDTIALTSFVGAGNGFVTTWYDQSGNGRNSVQSVAANQPLIVSAGVVSATGIRFDGSNDRLVSASTFTLLRPATAIGVLSNLSTGANYGPKPVYGFGGSTFIALLAVSQYSNNTLTVSSSSGAGSNFEGSQILPKAYTQGQFVLDSAIFTTTQYTHSLNGNSTSGNYTVTSYDANNIYFSIGNYYFYGYAKFDIKEVVYFSGNKSSDLAAISSNINSKYSIY